MTIFTELNRAWKRVFQQKEKPKKDDLASLLEKADAMGNRLVLVGAVSNEECLFAWRALAATIQDAFEQEIFFSLVWPEGDSAAILTVKLGDRAYRYPHIAYFDYLLYAQYASSRNVLIAEIKEAVLK